MPRVRLDEARPKLLCAEGSRLWELSLICTHYHPSVAQFARALSCGEPIVYDGDPLRDFGLMPFLDKFVFKNPKAPKRSERGGSIMQRAVTQKPEMAINQKAAVHNLLARPVGSVAAHEALLPHVL